MRLLLVTTDPTWTQAAREAAAELGAGIDVLPGVAEALAWMLRPDHACTHVLAAGPIQQVEIDALAGMVDEVTSRPTPLLLLGEERELGPSVIAVPEPYGAAIAQAVRDQLAYLPPDTALSRLQLRAALHAGWMRMRFQPILDAQSLAPVGLEALARLHHPTLGIIHPKDFLPQAIEHGQERGFAGITAARTMLELRGLSGVWTSTPLVFALNVPLTTFCEAYAVDRALELCGVAGVAADRITIELVETPHLPDLAVLRRAAARWRNHGFGVAIDDAGPALPHWRQLLELGFSSLKLDGRLAADAEQTALAAEITKGAQGNGLLVVAEGIEDDAALSRMRDIGVDAVQGFLFSRPLPGLAVPAWLKAWPAAGPLPSGALR
jgi:EAL domain-containing protein (putative c-di-GMP-specific phosphodiesterase class I)